MTKVRMLIHSICLDAVMQLEFNRELCTGSAMIHTLAHQ